MRLTLRSISAVQRAFAAALFHHDWHPRVKNLLLLKGEPRAIL
jgi:hypothetical protein